MAFFDRLNEMAKTVSEKTNDSLEINKLIGEINLTKGNIQSFQRELGEHFWASATRSQAVKSLRTVLVY